MIWNDHPHSGRVNGPLWRRASGLWGRRKGQPHTRGPSACFSKAFRPSFPICRFIYVILNPIKDSPKLNFHSPVIWKDELIFAESGSVRPEKEAARLWENAQRQRKITSPGHEGFWGLWCYLEKHKHLKISVFALLPFLVPSNLLGCFHCYFYTLQEKRLCVEYII